MADAVAVTRATRGHPEVRQGSSVRGAIDLTLVAGELLALRNIGITGPNVTRPPTPASRVYAEPPATPASRAYAETVFDAMVVALSGRIQLDETADTTPEAVLREIWDDRFVLTPASGAPG